MVKAIISRTPLQCSRLLEYGRRRVAAALAVVALPRRPPAPDVVERVVAVECERVGAVARRDVPSASGVALPLAAAA